MLRSLTSLKEAFTSFHSGKSEETFSTQLRQGRLKNILETAKVDYGDFYEDAKNLELDIQSDIDTKSKRLNEIQNETDSKATLKDGQTALEKKNAIRETYKDQTKEAEAKVGDLEKEVKDAKARVVDYCKKTFGPDYHFVRKSNWKNNISFIVAEIIIATIILGLEVGLNESLFYALGIEPGQAKLFAVCMSLVLAAANFFAGVSINWAIKHPMKKYKNYVWFAVFIVVGTVIFTYFYTGYRDAVLSKLNGMESGSSFITMMILACISYLAACLPPIFFMDGISYGEKRHLKGLQNDITHYENDLAEAREHRRTIKSKIEAEIKEVDKEKSENGAIVINNAEEVEALQKDIEQLGINLTEAKSGKDELITQIQTGFGEYVQKVLNHYRPSNETNPEFTGPESQTWSL